MRALTDGTLPPTPTITDVASELTMQQHPPGRSPESQRASAHRHPVTIFAAWLLVMLSGCGGVVDTGGASGGGGVGSGTGGTSTPIDGNRNASLTSSLGKTFGEPDDAFGQAIVAVFDVAGVARLQGTVSVPGDLDVFNLGSISRGDRLVIDAATSGSSLDVSVALFDAAGRLVHTNDDRGGGNDARFLDSFVDFIARHDGDSYFLVMARSAFADPGTTTGGYTVDVTLSPGADVPAPAQQIVVLDFDGAAVDSPALGRVTVGPFDAAAISPIYSGQTQLLKDIIRETFDQNYARFDVTIMTTDDPPLPPGAHFSSVYFGGFNPQAFGVSENVDLYNIDFCDDALIFTDSFNPAIFRRDPTATEMGIAIGNVGSHELGHLLGLNHVDDDLDLMDDRSAPDVFIDDQEFKESPLSTDIMPIGTQDGVLLLDEIVGPGPNEPGGPTASHLVATRR